MPRRRRRFSLSTKRLRRVLSWKFVFYDLLLPALRMLGPTRGDAILGLLGRWPWPFGRGAGNRFRASLERGQRGPRCRLVNRLDLAGAGSQRRPVPGPRLSARSTVGRGDP